jgi:MFS family permease
MTSPDTPSLDEDPAGANTTAALFRLHDFRLYASARFIGTLSMLIMSVAVGWQVYDITESPLALGYVGLAQFLPMTLFTLPAGDIADRIDRRYIVAASGLLETVAAGWLILLTLTHTGMSPGFMRRSPCSARLAPSWRPHRAPSYRFLFRRRRCRAPLR